MKTESLPATKPDASDNSNVHRSQISTAHKSSELGQHSPVSTKDFLVAQLQGDASNPTPQIPAGYRLQPPSNSHPEYHLPPSDKIIHVKHSDGETTFHLPSNVTFDTIRIVGHDLVLVQKDGTAIVLENAGDKIPNIEIGDVDVPKVALEAAFTTNGIQAAEGPGSAPAPSSGGQFADAGTPGLGNAFGLTPVLGAEGFSFTPTSISYPPPNLTGKLPSISLNANAEPSLLVSETHLTAATNNGINGSNPNSALTSVTGNFSVDFNASAGSAGGTVTYALSIHGGNGTASGLVDSQTGQSDVLTQSGNTITGHVGSVNGATAFTITVDPTTGNVTFTEDRAVVQQQDGNDPSGIAATFTAGMVTLTATITDNFGNSAAASLDLGKQLSITDGGPSIAVNAATAPALTLSETNLTAATNNGVNGSNPSINLTSTTGHFSNDFTDTSGADGTKSVTYALSIQGGNGTASGLVDSQTGQSDVLVQNGNTIEGHVGSATGALAFTIAVNPANGDVTFTEDRAVDQVQNSDTNLSQNIATLASNVVTLTQTITDNDGSTASASIDLGKQLSITDDHPVAHAGAAADSDGATLMVSAAAGLFGATSNGGAADLSGADAPAYVTSVSFGGTTHQLTGTGASATTTIAGADGTLTLNGDGSFSYVANHNVAVGTVDTFGYTITDSDGTTSTSTLAITIGAGTPPSAGGNSSEYVLESGLPQGSNPNPNAIVDQATVSFTAGADNVNVTLDSSSLTKTLAGFTGLTWVTSANGQEIDGYQGPVSNPADEVVKFVLSGATTIDAGHTGSVTVTETLLAPILGDTTATSDLGTLNVLANDPVNPSQSATDQIAVGVIDDHPVANAATLSVADDGSASVTASSGGLFAPTSTGGAADLAGADGLAKISIPVGDTTYSVTAASPSVTVPGQHGTLTLNFDGSYSYQANPNTKIGASDTFVYTLTDADGSTSTQDLVVTVGAGAPAIGGQSASETVYESGLSGGSHAGQEPVIAQASVQFTAGADHVGVGLSTSGLTTAAGLSWTTVTGTNGLVQEIDGYQNGKEVVSFVLSGATAIADGQTGTVTVTETLLAPILGVGTTQNDLGTLNVVATDAVNPGQPTATDQITVGVIEDHPIANPDVAADPSGHQLTANVITGAGEISGADVAGADGPVTVTGVEAGSHLGDTVTTGVGAVIGGAYGTLTLAADGSYTYAAKPDTTGLTGTETDTFTYTIKDADGSTATTTLTINVNEVQPTAPAVTGTVYEAGLANGSHQGLTTTTLQGTVPFSETNDTVKLTTVVWNGVTISIPQDGSNFAIGTGHGILTINDTGAYTYQLIGPEIGSSAPDSFTYTVTDAHGNTTTSALTFTIVHDAPVANADTASDPSGQQLTANVITGVGETSGADVAGADGPITVTGVEAGSHTGDIVTTGLNTEITTALGTLTMESDGSYTYQAKANESGTDTFTYTIKDADGSTSTTTLTINVNEVQPTAPAVTGTVYEAGLPNGSHVGPTTITQTGTLSFSENGDSLTLTSVNGTNVAQNGANTTIAGAHGTLVINDEGQYTYTLTSPEIGSSAPDSFTYTVTDSHGNTNTSTLTFTIVHDAPVANADTASDPSGHQLMANVITGVGEISGADVAGADGPVTVVGVEAGSHLGDTVTTGVGAVIGGAYGTLTLAANGSYTYTANPDTTGLTGTKADTFTYTIKDADGSTSTTTLTINVTEPAQPPVANGNSSEYVYESGLPQGSSPNSSHIVATTTVSFTAGTDNANVTLDSSSLTKTLAGFPSLTWVTSASGQEIDGYQNGNEVVTFAITAGASILAGDTGQVTVTETLLAPILGAGTTQNDLGTLNVVATDTVNSSQSATDHITVGVIDDAPVFQSADHGVVANVAGTDLTGHLTYLPGADAPVTLAFTGVSQNQASPTATSFTSNGLNVFEYVDNSGVLHGFTTLNGTSTDVFTVSLNATTSTYTFDLEHPLDAYQAATVPAGGNVEVHDSKSYAVISDASGNQVAVLTGYETTSNFNASNWFYETTNTLNSSDLTQGQIHASSNGEGVGNDNFEQTELMRFDFGAGSNTWSYGSAPSATANTTQVNQATFTIDALGGGGSNTIIDYVVHSTDGTVSNGSISTNSAYSTLTISGHGSIDYIELYADSGSAKIELSGVSEASTSSTMTLPFTFGITDNDGTTASGAFDVTASGAQQTVSYGIAGLDGTYTTIADTSGALGGSAHTSATNTLVGGPENDIFISQYGPDTMTGGGGSDIFKLENINASDVITDFISGSSGTHDTIDLTQLLNNLPTGTLSPTTFGQYVAYNPSTGALSVDPTGTPGSSNFHQVATLDVGNNVNSHPTSGTILIAYQDSTQHAHTHTV